MEKERKTLILAECGIMVAMAIVLSFIKVVDLPYGGSVTAFSMLPIIILSYRHGLRWGILTAFTYSLIQLLFGLNNLGYATSKTAAIAIIMLDYVVAFSCLGLVGIAKKHKNQTTVLLAGTAVVCVIRYICHVISGCTVWAGVSIPTSDGLFYSLGYNASYMVPETIVTLLAAGMLSEALDFRNERLTSRKHANKKKMGVIIIAVVVLVVLRILFF